MARKETILFRFREMIIYTGGESKSSWKSQLPVFFVPQATRGTLKQKSPGDNYSMSVGTPVVEELVLCCSYRPLYSLEVCPQSEKERFPRSPISSEPRRS